MTWTDADRLRAAHATMLAPHFLLEAVRDPRGVIVDFTIVDANDLACAFTQLSRDELTGTRLLTIVPGHLESGLFARYAHTVDTGEPLVLDEALYLDEMQGGEPHFFDIRAVRVDSDSLAITVQDVTARVDAMASLRASEEHYRLLAENTSDVVYETDAEGVVQWVSPSVERVLGWTPAEFVGRSAFDFVDRRYTQEPAQLRRQVFEGAPSPRHLQSFFTADGGARWMSVDARPIRDRHGDVIAAAVSLHDSQIEVTVQRAFDTLTAVHDVLLRTPDEDALLNEMCELAVEAGGYLFSWYGRRIDDAQCHVEAVASSAVHRDYLDEIEVSWGDGPTGQGPTGRAMRERTTQVVPDFLEHDAYSPWRDAATRRGFRSSIAIPVMVDDVIDGAWMVYAGEPAAFTPEAIGLLEELAGQLGYGMGRLRDAVRLLESARQQALLGTAIDQAAEAIMVTEPDGTIVYVNPATTASSGYPADELIGRNPRVFKSGLHDDRFYTELWDALADGRAWQGVMVNRRRDGTLYEEDVTISPVTDGARGLVAYVGVKRDLTRERRLEAVLSQEQRDRAALVALMDEVRPTGTIEATAGAFCEALCRLDDVDAATVLLVDHAGDLTVGGIVNRLRDPLLEVGTPAPMAGGAWVEELQDTRVRFEDLDHPTATPSRRFSDFAATARAGGLRAVAAAAISWEGRPLGILALGTGTEDGRASLFRRRGLVEELASFAGSLFGLQASARRDEQATRDDLTSILAGRRFHPEYQPIVDLASGATCGYEALARFDDGTRPDLEFERAVAVGLGSELEAACAAAAIEGAAGLPDDVWLSVNFSPDVVVDGTAARVVAAAAGRDLVIEITEHAAIDRYEEIRAAVAAFGGTRVSVDDAGAGFASLRHILELAPDFVKLDIGLVRDIDRDPARQALAAGLVHFATQTGITLIAEGVETEAEAQTLRVLGVRLGQGYLFGRPAPLA